MIFFFISKSAHVKKIRFVSKEDTNQFFMIKNSNLHLMKMQTSFLCEKNSDLHVMKMQIRFLFKEKFRSTSNEWLSISL